MKTVPVQNDHQYYAETAAARPADPGKLVRGLDPSDFVRAHRKGCWIGRPVALTDTSVLSAVAAELA